MLEARAHEFNKIIAGHFASGLGKNAGDQNGFHCPWLRG
jgi:hypothetical protein